MNNFYVVEEAHSDYGSCPEQYQVQADNPEDAVRIFLENHVHVALRDCAGSSYTGWKRFAVHVDPEPGERDEDGYSLVKGY